MRDLAAVLQVVAEALGPGRDELVEAWCRAVRSATAVSPSGDAELCAREADALLARLSAGAVADLLADDEASAAQALRAGKSLHLWIVATRVLAPSALSMLEAALPDKTALGDSLLALHELGVRRLEALVRAQEEDGARRLADAQDQAARAEEHAQEASRTNEALRRSESRSQHRAEQLALLSSVTHRIAGILDPDALMQEAATTIRARMNHTYVAVVVKDEEGALVGRWAGRPGVARESAGRSKGPPKGVIGRSMLKRAPQLVADVARDPDYIADVSGTRSEMVVPLIESGEVVGALDFQSEQPAAFDLDDVVAA